MYAISTALRNAIDAGKPQRILLEFPNNVTFSNEDVAITDGVTYTEMFTSEDDICIGSCPSASIEFSLLNDEGQLANFTFGQFKAWLGARIDSGTATGKTKTFTEGGVSRTYEFAPLGVFTAERPDVIKKAKVAVTANDRMVLFDKAMPSATDLSVTYPTTTGSLLSAMCTYLGVTLATQTFTNSDLAIASEPSQFKNATMREVLSWIAEAACAIARFNRDGNIEIAWYSTVQKTFSESGYSEFTPAWFQTEAITGTHIRNGNSNATLDLGTATNVYVIQDNPFLRQNDTNTRSRATPTAEEAINTKLQTAPQYHPYNASLFTDWTLQSGDVVTVTSDSESYTAPIHNMSLKWFGAPKVEISAAGNPKREVQDEEARKEYEAENTAYNNNRLILEANEQIVLKVSKGDVSTQLSVECGNVSITGGNLVVSGYIKASELATDIANISYLNLQSGYLQTFDFGSLDGNSVSAATGTIDTFNSDDITAAALTVDGTSITPSNLVTSIGPATVDSNTGGVSIPWSYLGGGSGTPVTFNIASTVYFQQAVAAAAAGVTVSGSWATNMFTASASNGQGAVGSFTVGDITSTSVNPNDGRYLTGTVPVTLVGGGSSSYTPTVNINATPSYNAGWASANSMVSIPLTGSGTTVVTKFPVSTVDTQGQVTYSLTADATPSATGKCYILTGAGVAAQLGIGAWYAAGWAAARALISTSDNKIYGPPATVDGTAEVMYTITSGVSSGSIYWQASRTARCDMTGTAYINGDAVRSSSRSQVNSLP